MSVMPMGKDGSANIALKQKKKIFKILQSEFFVN